MLSTARGNCKSSVLPLVVMSLILVLPFLCGKLPHSVDAEQVVLNLPPLNLAVVGTNGTQLLLNETDLTSLASYKGYGGYKNQLGNMRGLGNYTGVPLNTLCSLVGGLTDTCIVKVTATDDYSSNLTFAELNGEFLTYDIRTGEEAPHSQPLVPIVAYYFNDSNLAPDVGPLRLAIVGPEGLATKSAYWVRQVVRVEVIDATVPEFPSLMILSLLLLTALTSTLAFDVRRSPNRLSQSERLTDRRVVR